MLFWVIILEVPVHDLWDPLLLGLWQGYLIAAVGRQVEETAHLMTREQKRKREGRVPQAPLRAHSQYPKDLPLGPTS